jgi:hypothetical protein
MWRIDMHHECAVSQCGRPTQDRICQSHVDELVAAIRSIVSNPNPDANPTRLVLVANRGDEKRGEEAPTADPKKTVELATDHGGLWEDLDVTLTRQHTTPRMERVGSSAGSPMLHHEGASQAKRELESTVWYWVYLFANTNHHLTFDPFTATVPEACAWIAQFPGLIASLEGAEYMWGDFTRDTATAARVVDTHVPRVYLGECGSRLDIGWCQQHLYAPKGQASGACPVCGEGWFADARQSKLMRTARTHVLPATDISRVLGQIGIVIAPSTIRNYAMAKTVRGEEQPPKLVAVPKKDDECGPPRYLVGDVLDVFLGSAPKAA